MGCKNYKEITAVQEKEAKELANLDVDYIIGAHAHVLQKYDVIVADDGREVPCFYSLGNFQASIQQIEGNRDTLILCLDFEKDENGNVVLKEQSYIPCYTVTELNEAYYVTIPLTEENKSIVEDMDVVKARIQNAVGDKLSMKQGN